MDRLLQGTDEDTGQPYVLFARYKITTLASGGWEVLDEREGVRQVFADRQLALAAAGVPAEALEQLDAAPSVGSIVRVHGLISPVEAKALDQVAERQGLTREAAVRRAVAEYVLRNMG